MNLIYKTLLLSVIALENEASAHVTVKEDIDHLEKDVAFELKSEHILGGCCFFGLVCLFMVCYAVAPRHKIIDEDDHFKSCVSTDM